MSIVELKTRPAKINESVISRLEWVLEQARTGKVLSVAIALVNDEGETNCAWSATDDVLKLLASVARMQHRLNLNIDEQ